MSLASDPYRWGNPVIERATRQILDAGLRLGISAIEPASVSWSPEVAVDLRRRIIDNEDTGSGSFMEKLQAQLSGADRVTYLLCAELLYLHVVPLSNVGAATKRKRISTVLGWATPPTDLPTDLREVLGARGVFNGGTGFNVQIWQQVGWLLSFVQHWWQEPEDERASALEDPWAFRQIVASMPTDQPAIRNSLLYLAFPATFFPIVNQDHKRAIRDAFASVIGGATGKDPIAVDRDLLAIRTKQLDQTNGGPVNYYVEPFRSQWQKHRDQGQRAWLMRPQPPEPETVARWSTDGLVSLPATHLPDLEPGASLPTIRASVEDTYRHEDYARRLALATEFDMFCNRMKIDDLVAAIDGDRLHLGQITGEVTRSDSEERDFSRTVAWPTTDPIPVAELPERVRTDLEQPGTIVDLTAGLETLAPLVEPRGVDQPASPSRPERVVAAGQQLALRPATAELSGAVHLDQDWLQRIIDLLQDRRQIIFYGPPGTGKTYVARALAHHLAAREAVRLVQFHPSYAYEDFFEGYRPSQTDTGAVTFSLAPGPMRRLASDARHNPDKPHVLIIDEINRGNLAKIFGELYFLLEYRNDSIRLQYSAHDTFSLPPNVYFIGTMNTADRSIALIDAAMRRRFAFVELHPATSPVRYVLRRWLHAGNRQQDQRAALLEALNAEIGAEDRDFQIGPSYLMTPDNERPGGLERVWEHSILPLLEEHYYGRQSREQIHARFGLAALRAKMGQSADIPPGETPEPAGP